ncbi:MAG: carboxypeptidase-like regulatory domain-containing protein [Bacteroidales bacterium]|nr:carboxypeptidase-like regulatory domain-containing protein [Bacteroidales bacterium]
MKTKFQGSIFHIFLLSVLLFGASPDCYSLTQEKTIIKGVVTDASTGEPVPYASVLLKGTSVGTLTDATGKYLIETTIRASEIRFSFIGYDPETRPIRQGVAQTIDIKLKVTSITLNEVTVKPGKREYRNRNNPAVELIENVIRHKSLNRPESFDFLQYEKYEKIQLALSNITEDFKRAPIFRKYSFIFDNTDTTKRIGNEILPIYLKESISDNFYRKVPETRKEIIRAQKAINLEEYLDNKGVTANLNYIFQNINIYDNEILFLTNKFLSPIAGTAPAFYRYYITDTITLKDTRCIRLFFEPRNPSDFLFHGDLYVTLDSTFAVRSIDIGINKNINIDWVQGISVKQDFDNFGKNFWLLSKEDISIDVGLVKNSPGLYVQRTVSYKDYIVNVPVADSVFTGPIVSEITDPSESSPEFWEARRQIPLNSTERNLYSAVDSLKKVSSFRNQMGFVMLATTDFLELGRIEIGPVGSFYSFNSIEGSRLRFGGRTTPAFSKKITFEGYGAYGFEDRTFKYNSGVTLSLTPRTIYQFPVKSLKLSYTKDTRIPGQELQFNQGDNFFLSFKRGENDKLLMNNTLRFEYLNEFENHFSYLLGYNFTRQYPLGNLYYYKAGETPDADGRRNIDISEIYLNLRFAPNESFYQGKLYRDHFPNKYPVIQLNTAVGSEFMKSSYDYLRLQMNISRRYYVSILGYTDVALEAGKIFGTVSFPMLFVHAANQTYAYQRNAYNLMNFLEFVSDKYVSLNIDHSFNGFILNKIPLIKKLKFREIVTCKVIYGGIGGNNDPSRNNDLFRFPSGIDNIPLTYTLEKKPYVEAGIGLSNILRIFRVDLIKRFTYLDHPGISALGVRVQVKMDI